MRYLIHIAFLLLAATSGVAQQWPLHTQYFFNDLFYNPATAGHQATWEGFASVRSQWTGLQGRPATYLLGAEYGLGGTPWGFGGFLQNDVTGPMRRTGLTLSGSYQLNLKGKGQLYFGLAAGLYRLGLQSDVLVQNPNDPTLAAAQDGNWLPDANIGIYYTHGDYFGGISVPQFLQPSVDLYANGISSTYQSARAIYVTGGRHLQVHPEVRVTPSFLVRYSSPALVQLEVTGIATVKETVFGGLSYRSQDALAVIVGAHIESTYKIGYSYDITTSPLQQVSGGSHEVFLSYTMPVASDRDGDGIVDEKDDCPDEPGPRSNNGCPLTKEEKLVSTDADSDKDGIPDKDDDCPNTFGVKENRGCPIVEKDQQQTLDFAIKNLEFEWDKAIIMDTSLPYLDNLATLLNEKDDWKFYIAGHTDNSGTEEYNFRLSRKRAFAVRDYLIRKGVDKNRFSVEFFGEYMPIATNDTPEGRQKNRRVEMKFVFD